MAEETKLYDNENSSDDEITFKSDDNKYKSKTIDLLSADASTTPMENSNASIAESIKSLLQEFQNNNLNATLLYKIRENKSSAFRKDKDRYNGDGSTFISFRDDAERHLRKHQFSLSIFFINGKNVFF